MATLKLASGVARRRPIHQREAVILAALEAVGRPTFYQGSESWGAGRIAVIRHCLNITHANGVVNEGAGPFYRDANGVLYRYLPEGGLDHGLLVRPFDRTATPNQIRELRILVEIELRKLSTELYFRLLDDKTTEYFGRK